MSRRSIFSSAVILLTLTLFAGAAAKPKLKVAKDGFPTGQDTPEGAASDLARSFMRQDVPLFESVCIRPYGAGHSRTDYTEYLAGVTAHLKQQKGTPSPDSPIKIAKVFAARPLSKSGPASYGKASFDFLEVLFVDVEIVLGTGEQHLRRTMVIKDRDGKWYVHPVPDVSPLLSDGLYNEIGSIELFSDVYSIEK